MLSAAHVLFSFLNSAAVKFFCWENQNMLILFQFQLTCNVLPEIFTRNDEDSNAAVVIKLN